MARTVNLRLECMTDIVNIVKRLPKDIRSYEDMAFPEGCTAT